MNNQNIKQMNIDRLLLPLLVHPPFPTAAEKHRDFSIDFVILLHFGLDIHPLVAWAKRARIFMEISLCS